MSGAPDTSPPARPRDPIEQHYASKARRPSLKGLPSLALDAVRLSRRASPRLATFSSALTVVNVLLLLGQLLMAKLAFEALLESSRGDGSLAGAVLPIAGLIAATALSSVVAAAQRQAQRLLGQHVQRTMWRTMLEVTTRIPLETFESADFHEELERVKVNGLSQPITMANGLVAFAAGALGSIAVGVALIVLAPALLPALVLIGPPVAYLSRRQGRREYDHKVGQSLEERTRAYLLQLLTSRDEAKEVRAFALGGELTGRWEASYRRSFSALEHHLRRQLGLDLLTALVTVIAMSVALTLLVVLIRDGTIGLAEAGAAVLAVRLLSRQLTQTFGGVGSLFESSLFLEEYQRFLEHRLEGSDEAERRGGDLEPFRRMGAERVSFTYPGASRPALDDVTVEVRAGEVVALVGENGSGKTTLAKVLAGLYAPSHGRLLWGDRDVQEVSPEVLRRRVAVLFQDFVRYLLSAGQNVGLGRPEAMGDPAAVEAAARRADAHEFIAELPEGYDSMLGRLFGGYDLSGGQWQRIALARGFFRESEFLVLDEPTAALDPRSEHELFERMRDLSDGRAVLLISHRFSSVRSADRIYVLERGRLTEHGSHEELMELDGHYAELFSMQAEAYR